MLTLWLNLGLLQPASIHEVPTYWEKV